MHYLCSGLTVQGETVRRVTDHRETSNKMLNLRRRGARYAVGGTLAAAALGVMAVAVPSAEATTTAAQNHIIIGSGSSTTYNMMQSMDTLFNDSLGCYMTQPSTNVQTLSFKCASNNQDQQVGVGYEENPYNDVAVEEPALGSSAGIEQLELGGPGSGGSTVETAPVNFARSSRAPHLTGSEDDPGLNFVGYATDGVSWFTFPKINGVASASAGVGNLSLGQLEEIWNGTITKWNQLPGGKSSDSICVYVAQTSSGTESTWASALTFASAGDLNAYVDSNPKLPGCKSPKGETYAESHTIFENEGQSIVANGDESQAIFFFSYGKYSLECATATPSSKCNGGLKKTTPILGEIAGIKINPVTILCDTTACKVPWPVPRDLYNVYSNGSFSPTKSKEFGFPAATAATINYVSEIGFICKSQLTAGGKEVIDPSTGVWYRTEIAAAITESGFIPFPLQAHEDVNSVGTPAVEVLKADKSPTGYSDNDPIMGSTAAANEKLLDPKGYCEVYSTDGNTAP
jgi:ABC-type phosphate transport system substrate-binding protein